MIKLDLAHLFVEKYTNEYLLVDFVEEREFIYFKNNGDYIETMSLREEYEPTMLLFSNVRGLPLKDGDFFTVPMKQLIDLKSIREYQFGDDIEEFPMNLHMMFSNGEQLKQLFDSKQANKTNNTIRAFQQHVKETWEGGTPCSLNNLEPNFVLEVVDVGQGSTNLIYDDKTLTIFDCGVSIYFSKYECYNILREIQGLLDSSRKVSLIISHWDCDHYNLLTAMDDSLISSFCCVFVPSTVISLTAKYVLKRIYKNCRWIRSFKPLPVTKKRKIGMQPVISKKNYELYVGEKCSSTNNSGLALVIKGNNDIAILSADHSNYQIWDCIYSHISHSVKSKLNIVVPHHGGNCGKIKVKHLTEQSGIAAVSVGKNSYKHPQQNTIDEYKNLGFKVKRTDWERKNIVIQMR